MNRILRQNWKRTISYYPARVKMVETVDEIVAIVKDRENYPSPVRAAGSNHSTTRCIETNGGTLIDLTRMNKILRIDEQAETITMEPGVLYIDAAKKLEQHGLQFFVNVELGNMTVGSGACGGTKDASMPGEKGQVCSYVVAMKVVQPSGELLEVTEDDPELLRVMRSSYGLLGILCEVTYKVQKLRPLVVEHITYCLDDFADHLDQLIARDESMMMFLFPFLDKVIVEYRRYGEWSEDETPVTERWQWRLRNWIWKTVAPLFGFWATRLVPIKTVR